MFVDSHCHINFPEFAPRIDEVLRNMQNADVTHALCASVTLAEFPSVLALAELHSNIYASVGVHPDYEDIEEPSVEQLAALSQHPKIVAIGETGLDYYRLAGDLEWQRERFRTHIRAAKICHKPLIIHTRSASADTIRIMQEEGADQVAGVMHCFTESWPVAQAAMDMGFYISLSGIVTFKNAKDLHELARKVPLERLLIETDSPYLAPVPYRGKVNEPAYVCKVAAKIADLRELPLEDIALQTTENFFNLFSILNN